MNTQAIFLTAFQGFVNSISEETVEMTPSSAPLALSLLFFLQILMESQKHKGFKCCDQTHFGVNMSSEHPQWKSKKGTG